MKNIREIHPPTPANPVTHWKKWWQKQTPNHQDRFANLTPVAAVILFMAAIASAFWYLRGEEIEREQEAVRRDVEYAQQRLRLRLLERQEQVMRIARDISSKEIRKDQFSARAESLVLQYPEYQSLSWVDERRQIVATHAVSNLLQAQSLHSGDPLPQGETEIHYSLARDLNQPIYGVIESTQDKDAPQAMLQLHTPLTNDKGQFSGVLMAEYPLENLLRYGIPTEILAKYAISLVDADGTTLAGHTIKARTPVLPHFMGSNSLADNEYRTPVSPVGNGLLLRAQAWKTSTVMVGNGQFWVASALSVLTAWMLLANCSRMRLGSVMSVIEVIQPVWRPEASIRGETYMRASNKEPFFRRTRT